jgi:hypothetical protein
MLQREIINWEWYTDVNTCKLFLHCLLKVNYRQKKWQGIVINKGEFITSYEKLAVETGLTVSKVRTALSKIKGTNHIKVETTTTHTKIIILELGDFVVEVNQPETSKLNDKPNSTSLANSSQTNSISLATTNTNNKLLKNRKKIFRDKIFALSSFNNQVLESFFNYWSELNSDETKMRFEIQQFFEIEKRLKKWVLNDSKNNTVSKPKNELLTNR